MSERQRPDRFDGDAHPGADGDLCPLCGYVAPRRASRTSAHVFVVRRRMVGTVRTLAAVAAGP